MRDWTDVLAIVLIASILLSPFIFKAFIAYGTIDELTAMVKGKERVISRMGQESYYLIFTDKEVLMNADSWFWLKFNSSDIYGNLKIGKTYKFKVYGWRIRILSAYRNILKVEPVEMKEVQDER
ncbi:MAG: DUF1523 family protein [Clostridiales bacterium]|nr:DUF1523 family protein [Clostridiales bacterium]